MVELTISTFSPSIGGLLTGHFIKDHSDIKISWGKDNLLKISTNASIDSPITICRYLARLVPKLSLYGLTFIEEVEVDHWISFSIGPLSCSQEFFLSLQYLDQTLSLTTYLVGNHLTIADFVVWGTLASTQHWSKLSENNTYSNVNRWFLYIKNLSNVKSALSDFPEDVLKGKKEYKDEGKFVELPDAKKGEVVVRFPPEASGYLHIGHAKAALLNQHYQELFEGKLIMRFDDTNPDKEKIDFEKVILEDIDLLRIKPDKYSHTSDYFDVMIQMCEQLLKEGKAYVDDTHPDIMKQEREQRKASKNRENSVERNFRMWSEMLNGSEYGQKCCVRAKIDMESDNGCMRDPTIYRCKNEQHPKTGSTYKVYPTYDFACPIVDSIEGVTHALRTMEYHDRDEQYYWFIDALHLRKPHIWEYSRLNMMNAVLSKRKLTWFVDQQIVDSWEDPRLPTVRGILRRGLTVEGLKQFIVAQGSSRSVVQMEWDKIWAFNKKIIDPIAPRYTALKEDAVVIVNVKNANFETLHVARHPKNPSLGMRDIKTASQIYIDVNDVGNLQEGENATFINWGNIKIMKINRVWHSDPRIKNRTFSMKRTQDSNICDVFYTKVEETFIRSTSGRIYCSKALTRPNDLDIDIMTRGISGEILSIDAETNLTDTDFKKTSKLTWLPVINSLTSIEVLYYDHLITKPVLSKDDDFKEFINYESKKSVRFIGEEDLKDLKVNDIIQLQRIGFFRCDRSREANGSVVLIHIPDGSTKVQFVGEERLSSNNNVALCEDKGKKKSIIKEPFTETKAMPLSSQELEQIAVQWSKNRENYIKQKENKVKEKKCSPCKENKRSEESGENKKKLSKPVKPIDKSKNSEKNAGKQSRTRLGLEATKEDNLAEWYSQVITKGELIEYYDISGCYILRPWSFALWEVIRDFLDKEIKALGVQNCYFPIFVSKALLEKEKTHVADFAPEVAWVTKSGDSDLAEHIAIRPTSETVMYPTFAKWIQSYRDLPIKLNQWNNVVRWEFKHPQPFLRTREFLWQEGHTAYATYKEAEEEVYQILDIYARVYTDFLAVPVVKGWKTKKEKFAGGDYTTTVEAFVAASGRGIQAATSHHLGQNFSKMFEITYEDPETQEKKFVYQNSWGMTTRSIGVMIMVHADNQGLVLPPRAAALQIIVVPCGITVNLKEEEKKKLISSCKNLVKSIRDAGIRVKLDDRDNYSPGWKFNHWELKGVPLRVELGPNDLEKGQIVAVRRDTREKKTIDSDDKILDLKQLLDEIQQNLLQRATAELKSHTVTTSCWDQFCTALESKKIILSPFCEEESCEDNIKKDSARDQDLEPGAPAMGAKSLCIPFEQSHAVKESDKCIHPACKNKPKRYTLFGRSY